MHRTRGGQLAGSTRADLKNVRFILRFEEVFWWGEKKNRLRHQPVVFAGRHTGLKKVHLQDTTEFKRKRAHLNQLTKTKSKCRITKKPEGNMRSQSGEAAYIKDKLHRRLH